MVQLATRANRAVKMLSNQGLAHQVVGQILYCARATLVITGMGQSALHAIPVIYIQLHLERVLPGLLTNSLASARPAITEMGLFASLAFLEPIPHIQV